MSPAEEPVLDFLGISESDRSAYELWLRHPTWDVATMARALGQTEDEVAACCDGLLAGGLLTRHPSEPARVVPLGPDTVVEHRVAAAEAHAAQQRADGARVRAELSALVTAHLVERGEPSWQGLERIDDASTTHLRLDELTRAAEREMLALHTDDAHQCETTRASLSRYCRTLQRGLTIRVVYAQHVLTDAEALSPLQALVSDGAEVRTTTDVPLWMIMFDRSAAVVPLGDDPDDGCIVIGRTGLLTALQALFERCWQDARELRLPGQAATPDARPEDLPPQERDRLLLHLLSLGLKDEAVARHLGVSVRTVRRRVSGLFEDLDVTSRFQAGVEAERRGLLPVPAARP